jgi:hypothetical protein
MTSVLLVSPFLLAAAALPATVVDTPPPPPPSEPASPLVPALGAAAPTRGGIALAVAGGLAAVVPYGKATARWGIGGGLALEGGYRTFALVGHGGDLGVLYQIPWRRRGLVIAVMARTSYTTLALVPGEATGIAFSEAPLGNDWSAGMDLIATWLRAPSRAQLTFYAGPTIRLAGPEAVAPEAVERRFAPELRSALVGVRAEWPRSSAGRPFLGFEALVLLGTEIRPLGFLPAAIAGWAWRW